MDAGADTTAFLREGTREDTPRSNDGNRSNACRSGCAWEEMRVSSRHVTPAHITVSAEVFTQSIAVTINPSVFRPSTVWTVRTHPPPTVDRRASRAPPFVGTRSRRSIHRLPPPLPPPLPSPTLPATGHVRRKAGRVCIDNSITGSPRDRPAVLPVRPPRPSVRPPLPR